MESKSFEAEEEGLGEAHEASPEFVRWVQRSLNEASELRLPLDGIASPAMRSAVRSFQARQGLPVTGIVGTDTEEALREVTGASWERQKPPSLWSSRRSDPSPPSCGGCPTTIGPAVTHSTRQCSSREAAFISQPTSTARR